MTEPQLKVGDIVRVVGIPPKLPDDEFNTTELFQLCLGKTFPIRGFQGPLIQLDVGELRGEPATRIDLHRTRIRSNLHSQYRSVLVDKFPTWRAADRDSRGVQHNATTPGDAMGGS